MELLDCQQPNFLNGRFASVECKSGTLNAQGDNLIKIFCYSTFLQNIAKKKIVLIDFVIRIFE